MNNNNNNNIILFLPPCRSLDLPIADTTFQLKGVFEPATLSVNSSARFTLPFGPRRVTPAERNKMRTHVVKSAGVHGFRMTQHENNGGVKCFRGDRFMRRNVCFTNIVVSVTVNNIRLNGTVIGTNNWYYS